MNEEKVYCINCIHYEEKSNKCIVEKIDTPIEQKIRRRRCSKYNKNNDCNKFSKRNDTTKQ